MKKYVPVTKPTDSVKVKSESVLVLTIREAATRLGIGTDEMEGMVKSGKVKTLTAGWTVVVPASEVERLKS
jgi:excisionase family DNA binding protein